MARYALAYNKIRPILHNYQDFGRMWVSKGVSGLDAAFDPAYALVRKHEGYYLNHPEDKGGETYAGIARAFYPLWEGWAVLDAYKKQVGGYLMTNQIVPGMEQLVKSFYETKWQQSRAGEIVSQDVANIFFDFYILAARAVATMQEVLNGMGQNLKVDNAIGAKTIAAINSVNAGKLYQRYKDARIKYHKSRVESGKVSAVFLPGWIKRTMQFPDIWSPLPIAGLAIGTTAAVFAFYPPANKWIKKQYKTLVA